MDAFDENLKTFNETLYGNEMKDSLYRCFDLIRAELQYHANKLREIESKITIAEGVK